MGSVMGSDTLPPVTRRAFGAIKKRHYANGIRYEASYQVPWTTDATRGKDRVGRNFPTKADAEAWLAREHRRIELGEWDGPDRGKKRDQPPTLPTVTEWCHAVITTRSTRPAKPIGGAWKGKLTQYVDDYITPTIGHIRLDELTADHVKHWRTNPQLQAIPTAAGNTYAFLKSALNDAVTDGLIPANPCTLKGAGKPERARDPQPLNPTQYRALLDALGPATGGTTRQNENRAAFIIQGSLGLRIGEVAPLRRQHLDLTTGIVHIREAATRHKNDDGTWTHTTKRPKTAAGIRDAHLPPIVVPQLARLLSHVPNDPDAKLFAGRSTDSLRAAFKRAATAVGLPDLRTHDLRAAGATWAAQAGGTDKEIMRRAGHATLTVAMGYQTASDERDAQLATKLNSIFVANDSQA